MNFNLLFNRFESTFKLKIMLYSDELFELLGTSDPLSGIFDEDLIFHPLMDIRKDDAFTKINLCKKHFHFLDVSGTKTYLNPLLLEIDNKTLIELYSKAYEITNGDVSERFMTGLQIYFGYSTESGLIPIFEPVKMGWNGFDGGTMDDLYKIYRKGLYWKYDGAGLAPVSVDQFNILTANYRGAIQIKHNDDNSEPHLVFSSAKKDTESIIIPFQAIFKLTGTEKKLFIHNAVRKRLENPLATIKHSILISTSVMTLPGGSGAFSNRSHLCPPCDGNVIGFDLAS
ncbi:hypothetical protein D3C87_05540 [compost metagenome]